MFDNNTKIPNLQNDGQSINLPISFRQTLRNFLETAEHGVILFSMGSMFKLESLPEQKRDAFERALKKVQQRVIWKWESTAGKSINGNVLYMDWVPQRDVLGE